MQLHLLKQWRLLCRLGIPSSTFIWLVYEILMSPCGIKCCGATQRGPNARVAPAYLKLGSGEATSRVCLRPDWVRMKTRKGLFNPVGGMEQLPAPTYYRQRSRNRQTRRNACFMRCKAMRVFFRSSFLAAAPQMGSYPQKDAEMNHRQPHTRRFHRRRKDSMVRICPRLEDSSRGKAQKESRHERKRAANCHFSAVMLLKGGSPPPTCPFPEF